MRYLYTILFYLALPFVLIRLFWRSRRIPGSHQRWIERLGFCSFTLDKCIWVHAVSVGESLAAIPLIKNLQAEYPNLPVLVTSMTVTGAARVKAAFGDTVRQTFIPYDLPDMVGRFLNRVHPVIAVIMETELWPNLFAACQQRHIPIVIANARLSEKSAKGYQRIASVTRDMLSAVNCLASQGYADAERFIALGLAKEKISVTGNLKFDLELPAHLFERAVRLRQQLGSARLIWIAASTHPGEEEIILAAQRQIRSQHPQALLILVPRHPNRFDSVAALCEQQGFKIARRSQMQDVKSYDKTFRAGQDGAELNRQNSTESNMQSSTCAADIDIYLGDTMGELLLMYSVADIAFVAGSFIQIGGHNMLEPAALKKPILTGPILFNFAEISDMLLSAKGMMIVNNAEELTQQVNYFFAHESEREIMGENAYKVIEANRGALAKQVELVKKNVVIN